MSTKKYNIYYYKILLTENNQLCFLEGSKNIKDKILRFKNNHEEDETIFRTSDNEKIFEIIEIDDNYIFGSIGRLSNFENEPLTRERLLPGYETSKIIKENKLIEEYTYFLFDYNLLKCNIIYRKNIGNFTKIFSEFLNQHFKLSGIYDKVETVPVISEDVSERLNLATEIYKISFKYTSSKKTDDKFLLPKKLAKLKNSIREANISLMMNTNLDPKNLNEVKTSLIDENFDVYNDFKITTNNEVIDMVRGTITEKKRDKNKRWTINKLWIYKKYTNK